MKTAAKTGLAALTLLDIAASVPALADDAVDLFSGPYIGAHAGYYTGQGDFEGPAYPFVRSFGPGTIPARTLGFSIEDGLAGVHGGINFLIGSNIIAGFEADWSHLESGDSASASGAVVSQHDGNAFIYSHQSTSRLEFDWQTSLRGRIGYVFGSTLVYATSGVAFLRAEWTDTASGGPPFDPDRDQFSHSDKATLVGGVVGVGVDTAISPSIILGAEYLYENFESFSSVPFGLIDGPTGKIDDLEVHKFRVRLSIRFNLPDL